MPSNLHFLKSTLAAPDGSKRKRKSHEAGSPITLSIQGIQHYEEAGSSYFLGYMAARTLKWFDKIFNYKEEIYTLVDSDPSKTRRS